MPRFIGKNINDNSANFIDTEIAKQVSSSNRAGWYGTDWYSKTFNPDAGTDYSKIKQNLNAYKITNKKDVRCLDLTDSDMSNSPLKRFHQVVICGNSVEPLSQGADENLIGGYKNTEDYVITAQLPNSFRYSIGSNWSEPFKSVLDFSSANGLTSAATYGQNSALFGLATMSVWESPTPLQIQLTLQCLDDIGTGTNQNTLEAIDIFSRWALPYEVNKWGMYAGLPGPAVPPISIKYNKYDDNNQLVKDANGNKVTDNADLTIGNKKDTTRLSVLVGGMLFMDYCILKQVEVSYPNTKAQYLHDYHIATFTRDQSTTDAGIRLLPIRCDITLTFQTIMGLTQTNFRNMLALRDNSSMAGMGNIGLDKLQDLIGGNSLGDRVNSNVSAMIDDAKGLVGKFDKWKYGG